MLIEGLIIWTSLDWFEPSVKRFYHKRVTDPVHGAISLSKLESDVTSTRVFQRLHNVRQLGLAHLVFPGANYSRFSHSLGALHNASIMLDAVVVSGNSIDEENIQAVRLAALLHDIGHYPFSHATEHVVADFYAASLLSGVGDSTASLGTQPISSSDSISSVPLPTHFDHEALGAKIIAHDAELKEVFERNGFDPALLENVFQPGPENNLLPIISSDLDCDRLDYLRRTAHFSGAPYGSVDIRFIAGSAMLDTAGQFCFSHKAMRAADHLLVSRYYDYVQIPFQKTVSGLEWSLVTGLKACLDQGKFSCSAQSMISMIECGDWSKFDDQYVVGCFREIRENSSDQILTDHLDGIINRRPPKLAAGWEEIGPDAQKNVTEKHQAIRAALGDVAKEIGCDVGRLHIWQARTKLSSIQSGDEVSEVSAKAVHIMDPRSGRARPLVDHPDALMNTLSRSQYGGVRVYYLPETGEDSRNLRVRLCEELEKRVGIATTCTATRSM